MIKTENLCKTYGAGDGNVTALNDVSICIEDGEMIAVIGKSGSGKTTLLNILGCLDTATSGKAFYGDTEITRLSDAEAADFRLRNVGFVFQFFDLLPELTAAENILLPAKIAKRSAENFQEIVEKLELTERLKHYPSQLSGGQQQRTAIARAMINDPEILLCDEPTGALDTKTSAEIMDVFKTLNSDGKTIVIVTHDPKVAEQCGRIIEISDGRIV